jgi:hypothetical protein
MTAPYCADDTWTLWDASRGGIAQSGYFCCAAGLVGLLTEQCVDPATVASPTLEGMEMAPGGAPLSTTAAFAVTSTAIVNSVTGTTVTTTSISASTATTVGAGGNSTVTKSSSTKAPSTSSSLTPAGNPTVGTTPSSAAQPSTTKTSDGNISKTFRFGPAMLLQGVLALFIRAAL